MVELVKVKRDIEGKLREIIVSVDKQNIIIELNDRTEAEDLEHLKYFFGENVMQVVREYVRKNKVKFLVS